MSAISPTDRIALAESYVQACCGPQRSSAALQKLLSPTVKLIHLTDNVPNGQANGIAKVMQCYEEHLFEVTTAIVIESKEFEAIGENQVHMALVVAEDKDVDDKTTQTQSIKRYRFQDNTVFDFTRDTGDASLKISSIYTQATKTEIPSKSSHQGIIETGDMRI